MNKGQTFLPDFLASFLVFAVILTIFLSSWNSLLEDQVQFDTEDKMRLQGRYATLFMVTTSGYPENWESPSKEVVIPGFAEPDNMLQKDKLLAFKDISYSRQKDLLQAREFNLTVKEGNSVMSIDGEKMAFGSSYKDAETVIPFKRTVQVNDSGEISTARLRYVVWK